MPRPVRAKGTGSLSVAVLRAAAAVGPVEVGVELGAGGCRLIPVCTLPAVSPAEAVAAVRAVIRQEKARRPVAVRLTTKRPGEPEEQRVVALLGDEPGDAGCGVAG